MNKNIIFAGLFAALLPGVCAAVPPAPSETLHFGDETTLRQREEKIMDVVLDRNLSEAARRERVTQSLIALLKNPSAQDADNLARQVRRAVAAGADVNGRDEDGNKVLDVALRSGNADVVKFLVRKGADLGHGASNYGNLALALAEKRTRAKGQSAEPTGEAFESDVELAKFFRSRGVKPDMMALASAVHFKNDKLARYYISWFGPDVAQGNGRTALHQLAQWNDSDGVLYMLKAGANKSAENKNGDTPLVLATLPEVKALFSQNVPAAGEAPAQNVPAAQDAQEAAGAAEAAAASQKSQTQEQDLYPLHRAARRGDLARAQALIKGGADVNQVLDQADLRTPLMEAARFGHEKVLMLLIENKADLNKQSEQGYTALIWAVLQGKRASARMLVEKGADLNLTDSKGNTALHYAVARDYESLSSYLKKKGARTDVKNKEGKTAAQLEKEKIQAMALPRYFSK